MKKIINPDRNNWQSLLRRPVIDQSLLLDKVKAILNDVRDNGDEALRKYSLQFDKVDIDQFEVTAAEIAKAEELVSSSLKEAIHIAAANIKRFHEQQVQSPMVVETMPGVKCWRKAVAIDKVGLYIPGGTAPLFSTVLMLGIPARLAGCREVILCTPPGADGKIDPVILFASRLVGVTRIFKIGGAQAIGA